MKSIKVAAAIIKRDTDVFVTQRGYGEYKDRWEFPGGKVEEGETPQEALKREIREELAADIVVGSLLTTVEYDYPTFHISMDCFWAELPDGSTVKLLEHESSKWLSKNSLDSVDWLPADKIVVEVIKHSEIL